MYHSCNESSSLAVNCKAFHHHEPCTIAQLTMQSNYIHGQLGNYLNVYFFVIFNNQKKKNCAKNSKCFCYIFVDCFLIFLFKFYFFFYFVYFLYAIFIIFYCKKFVVNFIFSIIFCLLRLFIFK